MAPFHLPNVLTDFHPQSARPKRSAFLHVCSFFSSVSSVLLMKSSFLSDSASLACGVITFRINPTKNSTHDTTFVYLLHQLLQMLAAGFW